MDHDSPIASFDPTHFCQSWGLCCQTNLELKKLHDLKPSHPAITVSMSLQDAFKVIDAAIEIWHSVCGQDGNKFYYTQCLKTILQTPKNARYMIKALNKCQCCQRHQLHRPLSFYHTDWKIHVKPFADDSYYYYNKKCNCDNKHFPKTDYKCDCTCRHNARLIQECFLYTKH